MVHVAMTRVVEDARASFLESEPEACRWCEVSQACVRGDSGARRAVFELATGDSRVAGDALGELFRIAASGKEKRR